MKLAISNIAWDVSLESDVLKLLQRMNDSSPGVRMEGIEVAPTKVWPDWQGATPLAARACARRLADAGFSVPSFQSIVYGRPELSLLDTPALMLKHLAQVALLAEGFGARCLVYGAPKSRLRGARTWEQAVSEAIPTLREAGHICFEHGTVLVIEPNPPSYGCDFVTCAEEGLSLVSQVDHPGVRLHLDCAGMYLAGDDPTAAIERAGALLIHAHLSEPGLNPFTSPQAPQRAMLGALRSQHYAGWVAIEMRQTEASLADIERAFQHIQTCWEG